MTAIKGVWPVVLLFLAGCYSLGGPPEETRNYLLTPDPSPSAVSSAPIDSLGVGPVELAPYLDRPQIVTRKSENQRHLASYDHWAAPLQDTLLRVLAQNLEVMVPARTVVLYPWRRSEAPRYQLSVDVLQFDGAVDGPAVLKAYWTLFDAQKKVVLQRSSHIVEPLGAGDEGGQSVEASSYGAIVAAMNRCLGRFSAQVAAQIGQKNL